MRHKPQPGDIGLGVVAIAAVPARRCRDQPNLLIVADHPLGDAARARGLADVHRRTLFSLNAFVTTANDDRAIAAPASIGESRMPATG